MELSNGIDNVIKVSNGSGWLVKGRPEELWVWLVGEKMSRGAMELNEFIDIINILILWLAGRLVGWHTGYHVCHGCQTELGQG